MVIFEHHQGLALDQLQWEAGVFVVFGEGLLEDEAEILVDFLVGRKVPQVQDMTSLVWNELGAQQAWNLLDPLARMELHDVAAWMDAQLVQRLVKLVAETSFDLASCTELLNQKEFGATHQEHALELVILGHQMEQVAS